MSQPRMLVSQILLAACLTLLAGCASQETRSGGAEGEAAPARGASVDPQSPRRDLDVAPRKVAPVLMDALRYPYEPPQSSDCAGISAEIAELDAVLGVDLDSPKRPPRRDRAAERLLVSGVRSAIPYFGWVRRLVGTDRRQRLATSAAAAGFARRGFLKGLGREQGCAAPAAPIPREPPLPLPASPV